MDARTRKHLRLSYLGCRCEILQVNGAEPDQSQKCKGDIENISKGGFRFVTSARFELEDRIRAVIVFPDGESQQTFGRICYCNDDDHSDGYAYGFSILDGFIRRGQLLCVSNSISPVPVSGR